jgi:hypothetical protein
MLQDVYDAINGYVADINEKVQHLPVRGPSSKCVPLPPHKAPA